MKEVDRNKESTQWRAKFGEVNMIYEPLFELEKNGINIKYHTNQGEYTPAHWHGAIELMYILNGVGTILIEGKEYKMIAGEFIVVDSNQIHEARCARASMMIVIHFQEVR